MRQLIIARKDLQMSPGKLAAQVSHASMAFLAAQIKQKATPIWKYDGLPSFEMDRISGERKFGPKGYQNRDINRFSKEAFERGQDYFSVRAVDQGVDDGLFELCEIECISYSADLTISRDIYEEWFSGSFTKTVCEARNRNHLMRAVTLAEEQGLHEGADFFLIRDNCLTELEPEEVDEDGSGHTLTCIGFRPLPDEVAHAVSRKYHLYV